MIAMVVSLGGGMLKDRLLTETRDTTSAVRIDSVDRRLTEIEAANATRFEQLRQDLRDIKLDLEDRRRDRETRR